jgi:hypothetical protein
MCELLPGLVLLGSGPLLFNLEWWAISDTRCMVPSCLLLGGGGTGRIQNFWPKPAARGTRGTRPRYLHCTNITPIAWVGISSHVYDIFL